MRSSRWLLALAPGAENILDNLYNTWAQNLLGSRPWRSPFVARAEIGWTLTRFGRAVVDVASKRASLWLLSECGLYRNIFVQACSSFTSWASRSLVLLGDWHVLDWPLWVQLGHNPCRKSYKRYVVDTVSQRCQQALCAELAKHTTPLAYDRMGGLSGSVHKVMRSTLPMHALLGHRAWMRSRAGFLTFGHLQGRPSITNSVQCIFCELFVRSPWLHTLCSCKTWELRRDAIWKKMTCPESLVARVEAILGCSADSAAFEPVCDLFLDIEKAEASFWAQRNHHR